MRIDNRYTGVTQRGVDGKHSHYSNLRIARRAFNPESVRVEYRQISAQPLYSRRDVERLAETGDLERASALRDDYPGDDPFPLTGSSSFGTTKGLSQIVTPDLQGEGDLSLSLQIQDKRIANPYQLQAEMGLTKWGEVAVFRGFEPDEWIFGTEIGLLRKEPYLLSIGFINWSPHLDVDPQPFIEAGYWGEHHKVCAGAIHAGYKNEAILGYAYDFNERWRVQVDWQSGSENSSTIGFTCNVTPDFQFNPALYVSNDSKHDLFGYIVFTYTFHLWGGKRENGAGLTKSDERVAGAK